MVLIFSNTVNNYLRELPQIMWPTSVEIKMIKHTMNEINEKIKKP